MSSTIERYMYGPGQVWTYRNRQGEDQSRIIILKVEDRVVNYKKKKLIHIYVGGLSIDTPNRGVVPAIPYLVFTKYALDKSVIELIGKTLTLPDIGPGEFIWSNTSIKGKPSFYELEVANAIDIIEGVFDIMPTLHPSS